MMPGDPQYPTPEFCILNPMSKELQEATFGAGCFWGVEDLFRNTKGVAETEVGYMGGALEHPTYEDVCTDRTGHAEVVRMVYDPKVVAYEDLLRIFWEHHDPTTPDRQGPDVGTQYRSVVFYHTPEQRVAAEKMKVELENSGKFPLPVVTQIVPATTFWRAEEYHQRYLEKQGLGTCHA